MDTGGRGLFGDSGGLTCLACLCPCLGLLLFLSYRKRKQEAPKSPSKELLKPPPNSVGSSSGDIESPASSPMAKPLAISMADNNWQSPPAMAVDVEVPMDAVGPNKDAVSPQTSESALLKKTGTKMSDTTDSSQQDHLDRFWSEPDRQVSSDSPTKSSKTGSPVILIEDPTTEMDGDRRFDELASISSGGASAGLDSFSGESDEGYEAQLCEKGLPPALPPLRPGSKGQQSSACSKHKYKTLGCHLCNGTQYRPTPLGIKAEAARAAVPPLDLSSITGEAPLNRSKSVNHLNLPSEQPAECTLKSMPTMPLNSTSTTAPGSKSWKRQSKGGDLAPKVERKKKGSGMPGGGSKESSGSSKHKRSLLGLDGVPGNSPQLSKEKSKALKQKRVDELSK